MYLKDEVVLTSWVKKHFHLKKHVTNLRKDKTRRIKTSLGFFGLPSLIVSICLSIFSVPSMRGLKIGSLNINGGKNRHKFLRSQTKKRLICYSSQEHIRSHKMRHIGVYGGMVHIDLVI